MEAWNRGLERRTGRRTGMEDLNRGLKSDWDGKLDEGLEQRTERGLGRRTGQRTGAED